jgi:hypothetical protein
MQEQHRCLHEADWGSVKTNILNICKNVKDIKEKDLKDVRAHDKTIAAIKVWIYVLWVAVVGSFIWNLRLHDLW